MSLPLQLLRVIQCCRLTTDYAVTRHVGLLTLLDATRALRVCFQAGVPASVGRLAPLLAEEGIAVLLAQLSRPSIAGDWLVVVGLTLLWLRRSQVVQIGASCGAG